MKQLLQRHVLLFPRNVPENPKYFALQLISDYFLDGNYCVYS